MISNSTLFAQNANDTNQISLSIITNSGQGIIPTLECIAFFDDVGITYFLYRKGVNLDSFNNNTITIIK
jgi:hypothetical protein